MAQHEHQFNTRCLQLFETFFNEMTPDALVLVFRVYGQRCKDGRRNCLVRMPDVCARE